MVPAGQAEAFPPAGGGMSAGSWRRPLLALCGSDDPVPAVFPEPVPSALRMLSAGQQRIAAAIFAHLACSAADVMTRVEAQRERLRRGGQRRSDDIETLTALVRLLLEQPLDDAVAVADIQRAYLCLRHCHWWPTGPEDLPLAALLVAGSSGCDQAINQIEALHLALSEGDEVPGDPCALVALGGGVPEPSAVQVLERLGALRTELLLSGIAVQEDDLAVLPALASMALEPAMVMQEYIAARKLATGPTLIPPSSLVIGLAADSVVLRHLAGKDRKRFIAALVIRAWMDHRQQSPHPPS